jgi:signal peptidase II
VLLFGVALVTLTADVVSKVVAVATLSDRGPVTLVPGVLDLALYRNTGAAFSVGAGATLVFTAIAIGVASAIVRTASRLSSNGWAVVLGLLLGGAVGNLVDRLLRAPGPGRGAVVDWIHLHHWPVFNLADSAIVVGGVLALVLSTRGVRATDEEPG